MADEDLYALLGVSPSATPEEIKDAYRRQAMKWHPDRNPGNKEQSEEQFKRIAYAYKILSDLAEREKYDAWRASQRAQEGAQSRQYSSDAQGPGVSEEDAAAIFFEQMLDLAFELARRGYGEGTISRTLVELDCPAPIARAAAASAVKLASSSEARNSGATQDAHSVPMSIGALSWEKARPYYAAVIGGVYADERLPESRFEAYAKARVWRYIIFGGIGALAGAGIAMLNMRNELELAAFMGFFVGALSGLLLAALSLFFSADRAACMRERAMRYYLTAFECYHNARPLPFQLGSLNLWAWFGSIFWIAYRRMPAFALVGTVLVALVISIEAMIELDNPGLSKVFNLTGYGVAAVVGVIANRLYFLNAKARIRKFFSLPRDQALLGLREAGGVNSWAWIGYMGFFFLLLMPALYIQDSVQEERAAAAQAAEAQRNAAAAKEVRQTKAQAEEQKRYDKTVKELETRYPEINPDSPRYDEPLTTKVLSQKVEYEKQGLSSTQALRRAMADLGRP